MPTNLSTRFHDATLTQSPLAKYTVVETALNKDSFMRPNWIASLALVALLYLPCNCSPVTAQSSTEQARKYLLDRVDDVAIVQLYVDGFDRLPLNEKTLIYHLSPSSDRRTGHLHRPTLPIFLAHSIVTGRRSDSPGRSRCGNACGYRKIHETFLGQ